MKKSTYVNLRFLFSHYEAPTLFMMIGLPGSGKSYIAECLSEITGSEIVSSDAIRKELFGDENDQEHNNEVFNTVNSRIKNYLKDGKSVILDATNLSAKRRKNFIKTLENIKCAKIAVLIATDYELCLKQNSERERHVPEDVIKRMLTNICMPTFEEGFDYIYYIPHDDNTKSLYDYISETFNFDQDNPNHTLTLDKHLIKASTIMMKKNSEFAYLGYLHDIGKPFCKTYTKRNGTVDEHAHYYNHAHVGAYFYACALGKIVSSEKNMCPIPNSVLDIQVIQRHMDFFSFSKDNYKEDQENYFENLKKYYTDYSVLDLKRMLLDLHEADLEAH